MATHLLPPAARPRGMRCRLQSSILLSTRCYGIGWQWLRPTPPMSTVLVPTSETGSPCSSLTMG
jgi:hypothetical protein